MKFVLFAHSDQNAAYKRNSSPKVKAKEKKGAKLSSPFNLNIPIPKVLLKGAVSRNSAKLENYKRPVKLRET